MTARTVILRGAPVLDDAPSPGRPHRGPGLSGRVATVLHFAGTCPADAFGAVLVVRGRLVLHGLLVVPDGTDAATLDRLRRWGQRHQLDTAAGPVPWRVLTLADYFDPAATRARAPWAFQPNAYTGTGPVVGADLGRTFGMVAEHCSVPRGRDAGRWTVYLPGVGHDPDGNGWECRSAHRRPLRVRAGRVGWSVEFAPAERGHGKWTRQGPWRGEFVDLLSLAYTFDADRAGGFVDHAEHFGVAADELPVVASLDADGAAGMAAAVGSLHSLALALDAEVGRWFTTAADRREGVHRLPLSRLQSPAAIADHLLRQVGLTAPLARFDLSGVEVARWWEAFHGGRCDDLAALRGRPFDAVSLDLSSAYPLAAHLLGWWDLVTAERLERRNATEQVHQLCRRVARDPAAVLDPAAWAGLGFALCEVDADGDVLPLAVDDPTRPDGRVEVVPVTTRGRHLFYAWPDVVASAATTGKVPTIVEATRLVPVGRQGDPRRRVPLLPGLTLDTDADPAVALVGRRRAAKRDGQWAFSKALHNAVNALVSGNPSRLDDVQRKGTDGWERVERNGPWTFPPLAATVTASARLLLAVADRKVADLGGVVAYRDTDSSIIPASVEGGTLDLVDEVVRVLTQDEVDELHHAFDGLSPDPGAWPVWKVDPGPGEDPLQCIVFGPKRHVEFRTREGHVELADWTESGLGGRYLGPTPTWSATAVGREVAYVLDRLTSLRTATRSRAPWDAPGTDPLPTIEPRAVTSPAIGATLPPALGPIRPGTRFLRALPSPFSGRVDMAHAVALDRGDPAGAWRSLAWHDGATGEPVRLGVDPTDLGADVIAETLSARATSFAAVPRGDVIASVVVTPLSVRYVGRASPVIDATEDGTSGPLVDARVRYESAHGLGPGQYAELVTLARSLGPTRFAELAGVSVKVARSFARGQLPRRATVRAVLARLRTAGADLPAAACGCGCGSPVLGRRRAYLDDRHRERAKWRRRRERQAA